MYHLGLAIKRKFKKPRFAVFEKPLGGNRGYKPHKNREKNRFES